MLERQEKQDEADREYLMLQIAQVRQVLKHAYKEPAATPPDASFPVADDPALAFDRLSRLFGLSAFERGILLLCAASELDGECTRLCAAIQGSPQQFYPTFNLALTVFPNSYWAALAPAAPLRHWHLIEIEPGHALTLSPLRIDERILHYLLGVPGQQEKRLAGRFRQLRITERLVPSQQNIVQEIVAIWLAAASIEQAAWPVVQLRGSQIAYQQAIAATACAYFGCEISLLSIQDLPTHSDELETLLRLWEREALLASRALLLDCHSIDSLDPARAAAVTRLIEHSRLPLIIASQAQQVFPQHTVLTFDVEKPTASEQLMLWQAVLGDAASVLHSDLQMIAEHFRMNEASITTAWQATQGRLVASARPAETVMSEPEIVANILWETCRAQARPVFHELAQRIEPAATWDDLVLPESQQDQLRAIALHMRQRARVYEDWGFAGKTSRGLGISALFAGSSGVGKTMAAEVLARELHLDLYRVDLSSVVSKYIGETEKNLHRVFDTAEEGGVILLFDEADALFGKRSDVKDSHDRYANIETSYLLQRMEAYQGLAILTTNMQEVLDTAFLRRLRFLVQFPFPDAVQRAQIWQRIFPAPTPTGPLDIEKLAQLNIAGGNIRNIALAAAFLAADKDEPVQMRHILHAARQEYTKIGRALNSAEVRGWHIDE